MIRSFRIHVCYPLIAWPDDRKSNDTERLYYHYFDQSGLSRGSFLDFCRCNHIVHGKLKQRLRLDSSVVSIGVRYGSEMRDTFVGQLASMNMPHCTREQLQGAGDESSGFDYVYGYRLTAIMRLRMCDVADCSSSIRFGILCIVIFCLFLYPPFLGWRLRRVVVLGWPCWCGSFANFLLYLHCYKTRGGW